MRKRITVLFMVAVMMVWNGGFPVYGGDVSEGAVIEVQDVSFIPGFWHVSFEPDVFDYTVRVGDYMPDSQKVLVQVSSDCPDVSVTVNGLTMTALPEDEQVVEGAILLKSEPLPMTLGNNLVVIKASLEDLELVYTYKAFYMSSACNPVKDDSVVKHNKKVPEDMDEKGSESAIEAKYASTKNEETQGEEKGSPSLIGKVSAPDPEPDQAPSPEPAEEEEASDDPGNADSKGQGAKGPGKGKGN